jgi:hypothetical protein
MPMRTIRVVALALALAGSAPVAWGDGDAASPSAEELLARMKGADFHAADEAADALVRWKDDDFVPRALEQLKEETEFHARLSLGYVLAVHGEKAGLEVLVDSLEQTGHLGYVYLTRVADVDLGWDQDGSALIAWRKWLAGFTDDEYRERVRRRRLSPEVRRGGKEEFEAAVQALCEGADRTAVAGRLREFAKRFPMADTVPDALEAARELDREATEDAAWKEPVDSASLAGDARTTWLVHHLRDAKGAHLRFDGYTSVLPSRRKGDPPATGPVAELVAGGTRSVPVLLGLLEDRRPIRAAGWTMKRTSAREWESVRVVLRYQDAALEMLNVLLPTPTYDRKYTADYLSTEDPEDRAATIADVRSWAEETAGKSVLAARWAGIRRASTREALVAIRRIAVEAHQQKEALEELRKMFEGGRHRIFRPSICEVMADLGDTSRVAQVIAALDEGEYGSFESAVEEDSAVGHNAEMTARRIKEKYGKAAAPDPDPAGMESASPPK